MNHLDHGGPAFPVPGDGAFATVKDEGGELRQVLLNGMTLRDYAAIKFAAAWTIAIAGSGGFRAAREEDVADEAALLGLKQADAFLAAREIKS